MAVQHCAAIIASSSLEDNLETRLMAIINDYV